MSDRHLRRDGDAYAHALAELLPQGIAWPRYHGSVVMKVVRGLAGIWGFVDARAADLLERESDPRLTTELLPDWERAFGLPDPCMDEPLSIAARRQMLVQRMTLLGAQSREWFKEVASWIGATIQIREYAPFMCGISRCGITLDDQGYLRWQLGPPEMRFYWTVRIDQVRLDWFRCGSGECGIDPLLRIGINTDLECLFDRWKPAHTDIIFNYWGSLAETTLTTTADAVSRGSILKASLTTEANAVGTLV